MLQLKNIQKKYYTDEVETSALNSICLEVNEGDFISIMGPSGCGKSTLLSILGMLDSGDSGSYLFMDLEVLGFSEKELSSLRSKNIGYIFQSFNLINELTVSENIELPLIYNKICKKIRKEKIENIADKLNLSHRLNHFPRQLSGGQQQRVAIGRALIVDPKLILADEPTGNLDSENGLEVMKLLSNLNENGSTIVMVTHSERDARYGNRTLHLLDGKIVTDNHVCGS
ncbi:ABC transporter ATP-binding protein [Microbulbifer sp. EKSA005]|uniref:ABC transporter ATP-binding protein n=1 Tax=Microbulbifer sp. EKSA005 TaxID=3243364 RepID=UPI0040425367